MDRASHYLHRSGLRSPLPNTLTASNVKKQIERGGITAREYLRDTERAGEVESFLQDVHNDLSVVPAARTACIEALGVGRAHVQELNLMVTEDTVQGLLPIISRGEHRTLLTLRKHM